MAVLTLKPHKLQYMVVEEGYEDSNGDYHAGSSHWEGDISCDAVPANGKSNEIQFDDGIVRRYSYIVYMSSSERHFSVGERVKITLLNGVEREYEVKGFQRYQLQSKLWV